MPSLTMALARTLGLGIALAALLAVLAPATGHAQVDPPGCTPDVQFDPAIPRYADVVGKPLGDGPTGSTGRDTTAEILQYFDAVVAATQTHSRVRMLRKPYGTSVMGRPLVFYVLSTPENIANLDGGRRDAAFWAGVRDGSVSEAAGLSAVRSRPAPAWITATPHGAEPAAGEAISRNLYELAARTDCWNARRLRDMDFFLLPVRNPDGRDAIRRESAWGFDHNRDFGTQNQIENGAFLPLFKQYPGVFFIDAHQTTNGYFFPPNEDPVHHEISDFTVDYIGNLIGPALRQAFNDQSIDYFNYDTYDLFVPEYGDTVPSLLSGAAGMTFEKGTSEIYQKQAYEHYLAIDATIDVTARNKPAILTGWVRQWAEAVRQGRNCQLEPNELVSPRVISDPPQPEYPVCGYFLPPDRHEGDAAALVQHMRNQGVHVYRFDHPINAAGVREFGTGTSMTRVLPAGTLYMPLDQPLKHWIQAVMGEDPFEPVEFFYDVATWSYPLHRGLAGSGFLTQQLPPGVRMTEITDTGFGTVTGRDRPVYAFETDSMQALALVFELLDRGVQVDRASGAFTASGRSFTTGTALVSAASLRDRGVDLAALADRRETPVTGVNGYPVAHYAMTRPKVGVYSQQANDPNSPLEPNVALPAEDRGHCSEPGGTGGGAQAYCWALFNLTSKIGLPGYDKDDAPTATMHTVTSTELAAGELVADGYTALINPNQSAPTGAGATALQDFVNRGGTYVGTLLNGTTAARNAGITTLNATDPDERVDPFYTRGSTFTADYDVANPVSWGFDDDGFVYRESLATPVFDGASMGGNGGTIPPATAAMRYATPLKSLGHSRAAGRLEGQPSVVDQPFGAGHAVLFDHDPFYRSWKEYDERLVLNALFYPKGSVKPAAPGAETSSRGGDEPVAQPVPAAKLPTVGSRPARRGHTGERDIRIEVARRNAAKLKRAVRAAKLPKALRKRVRYRKTRRRAILVVRNARTASNDHQRGEWTRRVMFQLERRKAKVLFAHL